MVVVTESVVSELNGARTEQLRDVLESLALPEGRLSTGELERVVRAVAARPELFEDLVVDDVTNRWWLLLYKTDNYEVRILSWERDQSSDWHDHGGSSGAFAFTAGTVIEYYRASNQVDVETVRYGAGDHGSFGPSHVHDMLYEAGQPAVSVHAYSPPLKGLTFYDRTPFGFVARDFLLEEVRGETRSPGSRR
jgi:hypothetical protein